MKENFSVTKTLVEDENGELVIVFTEDELDDLGIETAEEIFKNNKEHNVD